jgi:DNA-directed RNA polymerase specialized sigma24 family protein
MDFDAALRQYGGEIRRIAHRQVLPGMDADDIASEMTIVLWKACSTYDKSTSTPFGTYWWSMWKNRRSDLNESYYAKKRARTVPVERVPETTYSDSFPLLPPTRDPVEAMVWRLLAEGESGKDVRMLTEMSRRRYYDLIASWRTDDIRDALLG